VGHWPHRGSLVAHWGNNKKANVMALRIAQIAPLAESVPPRLYGGTERIVSYLTDELVRQGHEVTLFASGDSLTTAQLVPCCRTALRLDPAVRDPVPHTILMLDEVRRRAEEFDILHFHIDYLHFPLFRPIRDRVLTTLHGRLDIPDLHPLYRVFDDMPLVSISDNQRKPLPWVRWAGTVHHGLPEYAFQLHPKPGRYLAFLGRISPEKQPDHAIAIAKRAGVPLKIAAKVDKVDQEYFDARIKPLLDHPLIEFVGEISEYEKNEFLGNALALLFPIDWPEPFGIVMIEAMAVGTPVIAYPVGSVSEVLEPGVSGLLVRGPEEAARAVERVAGFDRRAVRAAFERRFTARRMAQVYSRIYERVIADATGEPGPVFGLQEPSIDIA